jgi:putative phosphoesterase
VRDGAVRIGLISDTHGLLRPQALAFLAGSDCILHAGDIGGPHVIAGLEKIAPVHAVRGNNDSEPWADAIPGTARIDFGGVVVYMLHDLAELALDPRAQRIAVVVSGHSHRPSVRDVDGVLYVNPGSAGPRRFTLPVSVGELVVADGRARVRSETLRIA